MEHPWFSSLVVRGLINDSRQRSICQQSQVGPLRGQEVRMWQQQLSAQEFTQESVMGGWSRFMDGEEAGAEEAEEWGSSSRGGRGRN